jgi:hypothetical protein
VFAEFKRRIENLETALLSAVDVREGKGLF